jgi:hypothetical protein
VNFVRQRMEEVQPLDSRESNKGARIESKDHCVRAAFERSA